MAGRSLLMRTRASYGIWIWVRSVGVGWLHLGTSRAIEPCWAGSSWRAVARAFAVVTWPADRTVEVASSTLVGIERPSWATRWRVAAFLAVASSWASTSRHLILRVGYT